MPTTRPTILRFKLKSTGSPLDLMETFLPQGQTVLNRTEWRGKEPRSCGITNVSIQPYKHGSIEPKTVDIEVTYRPKGCISFIGRTKYDGWTARVIDRMQDGTLLDGHGKPLPEGEEPVYLSFELHHDVDFNAIDFGELVTESEVGSITRLQYDDILQMIQKSSRFSISVSSTFMAPRRHRPFVKVVLSNEPSGASIDGFGTRIVKVNSFTPHLQQVLLDELTDLVNGFVEGRYTIKNMSNDEFVFAELDDVLVDCTPNDQGGESRYDCLKEYLPDSFLEDLAKRLMATYEVEVSIVEGRHFGLLLKPAKKEPALA